MKRIYRALVAFLVGLVCCLSVVSAAPSFTKEQMDFMNEFRRESQERQEEFEKEHQEIVEKIEEGRRRVELGGKRFDITSHMPKEIVKQTMFVFDYLGFIEKTSEGKGIIGQTKMIFDEFKWKINEYNNMPDEADSPVLLLVIFTLGLCGIIILSETSHHSRMKKFHRLNGRRSVFDCSDVIYDFANDFARDNMHAEFVRQSTEFAMNEAMKAGTPFDHGGYMQGVGFNPSDTAAQQMNDMNNMGNMGGMF